MTRAREADTETTPEQTPFSSNGILVIDTVVASRKIARIEEAERATAREAMARETQATTAAAIDLVNACLENGGEPSLFETDQHPFNFDVPTEEGTVHVIFRAGSREKTRKEPINELWKYSLHVVGLPYSLSYNWSGSSVKIETQSQGPERENPVADVVNLRNLMVSLSEGVRSQAIPFHRTG